MRFDSGHSSRNYNKIFRELEVLDARLTDDGIYQCDIKTHDGKTATKQSVINIYGESRAQFSRFSVCFKKLAGIESET